MRDMTKGELEARAQRANALLGNSTFQEAAAAVDAELKDRILRTSLSERDKREDAFALYSGFRETLKMLKKWADAAHINRENDDN